ncbi:two-component system response regulator DesR [Nakamurella sp. UYEF19]|uniref:response regulator transcription factor n=1 Tax=Nakamurella sp. UYEF19 TaxID=1756392 RepID=UPI003398F310
MIRILLAEDTNMVRGALVALLNLESDLEVVAEVDNGDLIEPTALRVKPDVAVLDIDLPGLDGLSAAMRLHEVLPSCRTLMLTSLGRPGTLRRALNAQVTGFLLKDAPPSQLAESVRKVARGERVIDKELALAAWDSRENPLTAREMEVLQLAAVGAEVSEIAKSLYLSAGTVRNYLTTILSKLNARNRLDAVRLATEAGWLI